MGFGQFVDDIARKYSPNSSISKGDIALEGATKSEAARHAEKARSKYRSKNLGEGSEMTDDYIKMEDAHVKQLMSQPKYQEKVARQGRLRADNSATTQQWLKTSRAEDDLIYQSAAGGSITGAAIGGIGSLFTDAGFMESAMMGGIAGGVGAGYNNRKNIINTNNHNAGVDKKVSRMKSIRDQHQKKAPIDPDRQIVADKKEYLDRKAKFDKHSYTTKRLDKLSQRIDDSRLSGVAGPQFLGAGTLAGAGSLAYATLDSNRG